MCLFDRFRNKITGSNVEKFLRKLEEVYVDKGNWKTYYREATRRVYWVKYYPNPEVHGGGAPELKRIKELPVEVRNALDE